MRNGKLMTKRVAAIALSSMMVLSPLTAFASSGNVPGSSGDPTIQAPNGSDPVSYAQSGDIFGVYLQDADGNYILDQDGKRILVEQGSGSIQTGKIKDPTSSAEINTYFLDSEETGRSPEKTVTDKAGVEHKYTDVTTAYFKKTISLRDYKNKTNFTPSVPDVVYTYKVYTAPGVDVTATGTNQYGQPASYNGAAINAGIAGGIHFNGNDTAKLAFNHGDDPVNDVPAANTGLGKKEEDPYTMTRLMGFDIDVDKFQNQDPGVYRYLIMEFDEENADASYDGTTKDILDDVTKIADEYRGRIIDVVIERVTADPSDGTRKIAGVALREVTLSYEEEGQLDSWKIVTVNNDIKVEGYTPYSFNLTGSTEPGPKEAHSRYYTFDLLVNKEVTGQGLTDKDVAATYSITIDLEGPVKNKVTVVVSNADTGAVEGDDWTLDEDGKISKTIGLKHNQSVEISGLPSGATYTIKEAKDSVLSKVLTNTELNKTVDGTITMDAADEIVEKVDDVKAIQSSTKDVTNNVDEKKNVIVANAETVKKLKVGDVAAVVEGETLLEGIDVQNVIITNERLPITVTGVVMNVAPYALMVIAAAIFAGLFISKKRQEEEI